LGIKHFRDLHQRAQGLQVLRVVGDVTGEVLINFDDVGLDLRPQAQAGMAIAKIVQRELHAERAEVIHRPGQRIEILYALVLGDLEYQTAGLHFRVAERAAQGFNPQFVQHIYQHVGADIDEQAAGRLPLNPAFNSQNQGFGFELELEAPCCGGTVSNELFDMASSKRQKIRKLKYKKIRPIIKS
jgi:hypothetical protein